jgi:DNA polymerase (family X)
MHPPKTFPAQIAAVVARRIINELSPACDRIEIAGSLRRRKNVVHDIDIVLLPRDASEPFVLGKPTTVDGLLHRLVDNGSLTPGRGKEKMKCFVATKTGIPVDIYFATHQTWATLLLIRTGSKEHNIRLAQRARQLGMKLRASGDGVEAANGEILGIQTEEEIFSLLQFPYLRPEQRQ